MFSKNIWLNDIIGGLTNFINVLIQWMDNVAPTTPARFQVPTQRPTTTRLQGSKVAASRLHLQRHYCLDNTIRNLGLHPVASCYEVCKILTLLPSISANRNTILPQQHYPGLKFPHSGQPLQGGSRIAWPTPFGSRLAFFHIQ